VKKKILIGLGGLFVLLLAAVLVIPSFIDWNQYKALATRIAKESTGRDLVIGGDMTLSLLPKPAVVVNDVRLSNLPGAKAAEMVTLKTLEVRVALAPLLGGNVQVERVRVVDPVIEIETLADGRSNLSFETEERNAAAATAPTEGAKDQAAPGGGSAFDLQLDNLTLENGTVVHRDSRTGTVERIEEINAQMALASLTGPVEGQGRLKVRGLPLTFSGTVGKAIHGRTVPLDLSFGFGAGNAQAKVSGTLVGLETDPGFKGKVDVKGDDLAALVGGLTGNPLPGFAGKPFALSGNLAGSKAEVGIPDLTASLGDTQMTGDLGATLEGGIAAHANLNVGRVDLDALMASLGTGAAAPASVPAGKAEAPAADPAAKAQQAFSLPKDVSASLRLGVEAMSYKGGVIRQARLNADLANGEITLSQLSAQLPGSTDVAVFGFVTAKNGKPRLEGEAEVTAADLRAVMTWLGVDLPPDIPKERLRRLAGKSSFVATEEQVQVAGLDMRMDGTTVTGGATVKLGGRPSFGVDLAVDKINLDGYMPAAPAPAAKGGTGSGAKGDGKAAPAAAGPGGVPALKAFDANLKVAVKSVTYRQIPISDVLLDGTLHNGNLDLRRLSVGQAAGASLSARGGLPKLDSQPEMKDLHLDFAAADLGPLFRLAGIEAPPQAKGLGRVSVKGKVNGGFSRPVLDAAIQAAGAQVDIDGSLAAAPALALDARIGLKHADIAQLARTLGVDYRPSGRLGATDISLHAKGGTDKLVLGDIKGTLAGVSLSGNGQVDLTGAKPKLGIELSTGEVKVDSFLPVQRAAALPGDGKVRHAGGRYRPAFLEALERPIVLAAAPAAKPTTATAPVAGGVDPRWSRDPLDLSALASVDADVLLRSAAILFQDYRLDNADIALNLANGLLRTNRATGTLFGGAVQANATLDATRNAKTDLTLQVANLDVGRAVAAAAGKGMAGGSLNLDLRANTQGGSVAQLVQALGGNGSLAIKGLDVKQGARGSALAGILDLMMNLNTLGGALSGGKGALADITGTFTIERGIVRSQDARLVSGVGNGDAVATVDLPRWTIDSQGKVEVTQGVLTQILAQKANVQNTTLPFYINGRLDAPNVKLDTASLPGKGIAIPGTEKLLKKKGVGTLLETVLPGVTGGTQQQGGTTTQQPTGTTTQPQSSGGLFGGVPVPTQQPSSTTQQQQQQQKPSKPKAEDLLRGILLGR
jgi:uncharacterized protein involved in outer membrane biogenesis